MKTRTFKKGDRVTWESQAGGFCSEKKGEILAVLSSGTYDKKHFVTIATKAGALCQKIDGGTRKHESYVILAERDNDKAKPVIYWPVVSKLRHRRGRKPGCEPNRPKTARAETTTDQINDSTSNATA